MAICHNKQFENYYCKYCRNRGEFAVRVAGSGASEGAPCDVIRISQGVTYMVEVKATKEMCYKPTKLVRYQFQKLQQIANINGVTPLVAIRFKHHGWLELDISHKIPIRVEYVNT